MLHNEIIISIMIFNKSPVVLSRNAVKKVTWQGMGWEGDSFLE